MSPARKGTPSEPAPLDGFPVSRKAAGALGGEGERQKGGAPMAGKLVIVVNGKGGVGKDALCASVAGQWKTASVSAIDPIKEIARQFGWNGEKDPRARRFLAELKQAFIHYNDLPTRFLVERTQEFLAGPQELLFVHIREGDQIRRYREAIAPQRCATLLIRRSSVDGAAAYGNAADDQVEAFEYDYRFQNDLPLEESAQAFAQLIARMIADAGG